VIEVFRSIKMWDYLMAPTFFAFQLKCEVNSALEFRIWLAARMKIELQK